MKLLLCGLFLICALNCFSQYKYEEIILVDSATKDELFNKAVEWFAYKYKSAQDVIQYKDDGKIIGKGNFKASYYTRDPRISHTITISVKDGKYKYTIEDFIYSDNQGKEFALEDFPKSWAGKKNLLEKVDEEVRGIIKDLKKYMAKKDDW